MGVRKLLPILRGFEKFLPSLGEGMRNFLTWFFTHFFRKNWRPASLIEVKRVVHKNYIYFEIFEKIFSSISYHKHVKHLKYLSPDIISKKFAVFLRNRKFIISKFLQKCVTIGLFPVDHLNTRSRYN